MAVPFLLLYGVFAANATASDPPLHLARCVFAHTEGQLVWIYRHA